MLIFGISIAVGLYSLLSAVLWFFWTGTSAEFLRFFLPFHAAVVFTGGSLILGGISLSPNRPRIGVLLTLVASAAVFGLGLLAASGYVLNPLRPELFQPFKWPSHPLLRTLLGLGLPLIGFLALFRRIGSWVLMIGGAMLLITQIFLLTAGVTVTAIVAALIGIGFILAGNRQYQERSLRY